MSLNLSEGRPVPHVGGPYQELPRLSTVPRCRCRTRPTPDTGFVSAAKLTPQHAQNFMPLIFYTMLALVQEFLPHMLEQGDGAILTAQGGSTCGACRT